MANALYNKWIQSLFTVSGKTFLVLAVDSGAYTVNTGDAGHEFVSDIAHAAILSAKQLSSPTWTSRVLDFADLTNTFPDPGSGSAEALVFVDRVTTTHAVSAVNTGTKTFTFAGNVAEDFVPGDTFSIAGSTGNDGTYNIVSSTFSTNTDVVVVEAIPDATADGTATSMDASASRIMNYIDTATGLPVTFDGIDDSIVMNASGVIKLGS